MKYYNYTKHTSLNIIILRYQHLENSIGLLKDSDGIDIQYIGSTQVQTHIKGTNKFSNENIIKAPERKVRIGTNPHGPAVT